MLSPLTHDDPQSIASYRLLARLGSGGMGTVYLARSPGGRTVALKTVHARLAADPAFRARFRLEADAARIIGDRHGAAVVASDPLAETPWLATEYVLGPPLDDAVALAGPLPEPTVRALGAALAGALRQLHSSDVVHRDLKPSNILVTAHGPKVIDFGIARAAGDDRLTSTGAAAGTPAYMSPEQASGEEHTPAGDVFALAGVLVFAATGRPPFGSGAPADLLYRVRYAEPDLSTAPPSLRPLLAACLAKDPSARPDPATLVAELHDGHGDFADHLPPPLLAAIARRATDVWHPHPPRLPAPAQDPYTTALPTPPRLSRRRLLTLGGGAAVAAAGGVWAWQASRPRSGSPEGASGSGSTPTTPLPATTASDGAPRPLWQAEASDRDESVTPFLAGGVAGFVETAEFRARDVRTGRELWSSSSVMRPRQVTSDGSRFYTSTGSIEGPSALLIDTYAPRYVKAAAKQVQVKGFDGSALDSWLLTASDGRLYAVSRLGGRDDSLEKKQTGWHLLAIDLRTGKEAWRQAGSDADRTLVGVVVGDRLITVARLPTPESYVVTARNAHTGARLWERSFPLAEGNGERVPIAGQLATDATHVYLGGRRLRALRLTDGSVAWEYGQDAYFYGLPVVADDLLYATEGDRGLIALSAGKGARRWEEAPPARDLTPLLGVVPVVGEKYVYAPVRGGLSAVDLDSRRSAWVFPTDATRYAVDRQGKRIIGAGATTAVAFTLA